MGNGDRKEKRFILIPKRDTLTQETDISLCRESTQCSLPGLSGRRLDRALSPWLPMTLSRAIPPHLRVKWRALEMSLRHSKGEGGMWEVVIRSVSHRLTILQTLIKDNRPKLSTTGQKSGLKWTAAHKSVKL